MTHGTGIMIHQEVYGQYQMENFKVVERSNRHQCNVCNKVFVSVKGLEQHGAVHNEHKRYKCEICFKSFRFQSNLMEHKSVHTGSTPYACPYCGKASRLKGNLKKHLRTHVTNQEELEAAWRPFARLGINQLVNTTSSPPKTHSIDTFDDVFFNSEYTDTSTPVSRKKKKTVVRSQEAVKLMETVPKVEIPQKKELDDKFWRLEDNIYNNLSIDGWKSVFDAGKSIEFEKHNCPTCKGEFMNRQDCINHHRIEHKSTPDDFENFCEICFRSFGDEKTFQKHVEHHERVKKLMDNGSIDRHEPEFLIPTDDDISRVLNFLR